MASSEARGKVNWQVFNGLPGWSVPFAEIEGGAPGPTWLFTAAVHGDEYEGPEAIRRAASALQGVSFAGRVIALPVTNPKAYAAGVRCTPSDGGNLNRLFPGETTGGESSRWAAALWDKFMSRADRLIDMHAGGATWAFEPVSGFYRDEDAALAATMGLTLWRAPETPGVLSREFRRLRGPSVGIELGFGGTRDESLTARATQGLLDLVHDRLATPTGPIYRHEDIITPREGEWISRVSIRQSVRRGEVLGVVQAWTGEIVCEVKAPFDARVLAVRRLVSVGRGDLVAVLGVV